MNNSKGYTLIEMMITVTVMTILLIALSGLMSGMSSTFISLKDTSEAEIDARVNARLLTDELKGTSIGMVTIFKDTPSGGSDTISYQVPQMSDTDNDGVPDMPLVTNGAIQWQENARTIGLDPDNATDLVKIIGGIKTLLATDVTSIRFFDVNDDIDVLWDEIKVALIITKSNALGRSYSTQVMTTVNLRNSD
jgi:prepilin-type N-terminal cleavage/methylation domain-containing protein